MLEALSYLGAILLAVTVGWSVFMMAYGSPGVLTGLNNRCDRLSLACNTLSGFAIPLLSVALASAVFLFYRLRVVKSPITQKARDRPDELVQTAGPTTGTIVGRDELCQVIMEDIRDPLARRPHLVVGGVGTGKTAVLVRLTKLLADHGAVPVPIRLRDAQDDLDFREMAWNRFRSLAEGIVLSAGEAEKIWRQLRKDDQIVVVADGLEEALSEGSAKADRDNLIRLAIHQARELGLPLVIASRPHEPLRGADATIMELEPLSEEAALDYISEYASNEDARRLDWLVETAGLTELPLYLQITRQLCLHDRLDHLTAGRGRRKLDTRSIDRSELRLNLLDTWLEALFDGHLMPAIPLSRAEREAGVEWLSALACIGLLRDSIDVKFDDYASRPGVPRRGTGVRSRYPEIDSKVKTAVAAKLPRRKLDIRLAVAWADRLNLADAHGDGLRFRHSIMQAYLGSRFMRTALLDAEFKKDLYSALRNPGRELLIALVLYCRQEAATAREPVRPQLEAGPEPAAITAASPPRPAARPAQRQVARTRRAPVPAPRPVPGSGSTAEPAAAGPAAPAPGAAGPDVPAGPPPGADGIAPGTLKPADVASIRELLKDRAWAATEDVKALDLYAAALEIDSFLDQPSTDRIAAKIAERWPNIRGGDQATIDEAKLGLVRRFGDAIRTIEDRRARARADSGQPPGGQSGDLPQRAYGQLFLIGCRELSYPIRLAIAQETGAGGDSACAALHDTRSAAALAAATEDFMWRDRTMAAWLAPLLVGSADQRARDARHELEALLAQVGRNEHDQGSGPLPIAVEIALAQGFKYAANRLRRHPHGGPGARVYLAEQAMAMLERARFWFSQVTLIHALCLWEMPDPDARRSALRQERDRDGRGNQPGRRGSDPEAVVGHWLRIASKRRHPFVSGAAELAAEALRTRQPERYLWIDESGVVSRVGSGAAQGATYRKHNLWIPPSTGWSGLDPRAQQLVANALLLLNLAERGQQPEQLERRLQRADRGELPPCLTANREPLDPTRTVGGADTSAPGTNCLDGCPFRLCPYPPSGVQPHRAELSEAFCHGQQALLRGRQARAAAGAWQSSVPAGELRRFWEKMADRARGDGAAPELY